MAAIIPRPSRTRLHNKATRPAPPCLKLHDTTPQQTLTLSDSNSSSSNHSLSGPGNGSGNNTGTGIGSGPLLGAGRTNNSQSNSNLNQPQRTTSPDSQSGGSGGSAHSGLASMPFSTSYPSYRPYTPTTPTTPSIAHSVPMTPTSNSSNSVVYGLGFPLSPRHEGFSGHSVRQHQYGNSSGGLYPTFTATSKGQRTTGTRRMPSNDTSLYDPYRSRQPGVSANRVKSEYQAQSPMRESHATFPTQSYHGGRGSSEHVYEFPHHLLDGSVLTDEQAFAMMHAPPTAVHREDLYRASPTLTASQTLAATYSHVRPDSPFQTFQPYHSYQPYSGSRDLPSPGAPPSISGFSSQSLVSTPYMALEEKCESRAADPYRSAYSQQQQHPSSVGKADGATQQLASPALGSQNTHSLGSSPIMNDEFSSSFESRFSGMNNNSNNSSNNNNNVTPRYAMHVLANQESNHALSASFYEGRRAKSTTTASSERGGVADRAMTDISDPKDLDQDHDLSASGISAGDPSSMHTRTSTSLAHQTSSQPSKTDSAGTHKARTVEDAENDVILQKLGVFNRDSGGARSGMTHSSGRTRRKGQWTDDSEEEGRSRGMARRRRSAICLGMTLSFMVCLAITLFFVVPRTPAFSFESLTSDGAPAFTKDRIRQLFSIQILVDSQSNYLPIRVDAFDIWLQMSGDKIADNYDLPSSLAIEPGVVQVMSMPMRLDYKIQRHEDGEEDTTFDTLMTACQPMRDNSSSIDNWKTLPKLDLTVGGRLHVWGLSWVWKPEFRFSVDRVPCPTNAKPSSSQPDAQGNPLFPSSTPRTIMPTVTAIVANAADPPAAIVTPLLH
ncbi:hypothetical protein BG004_006642 [Podila humilis]|nr:hypothetical protein BG004_006642 [Podila humilis]